MDSFKGDHNRIRVENFLSDNVRFADGSEDAVVMFADLVGSTEFKRDHKPLAGIAKTVQHNKVASEQIVAHGGTVVKYIGDAVMGMFVGPECRQCAMRAALRTIIQIEASNAAHGWTFPFAMSTKIGMAHGKVWTFNFPESNVPDPLGVTVDLAARLASIAGPQQAVCTEEFFQACSDVPKCSSAEPVKRYVKGIREILNLRVVVPEGAFCQHTHLHGVPTPLEKELREGMALLRKRQRDQALAVFKAVLDKEPGNFHSNYHCAVILTARAKTADDLEKALQYACNAKWARPTSSCLWHLIGKLRARQFEITKDEQFLEMAIKNAEVALVCAEDNLENESAFQAKYCLTRYLLLRRKIALRNGTRTIADEDLARAVLLREELRTALDDSTSRHRVEFCLTNTLVCIATKAFAEAHSAIAEALKIDPNANGALVVKLHLLKVEEDGEDVADGPIV